jgi:hypothetical protein
MTYAESLYAAAMQNQQSEDFPEMMLLSSNEVS